MEQIKTVINNEEVFDKLPDISILDMLYAENATVDTFVDFFTNDVLRKKFQQMLSYVIDNDTLNVIKNALIDETIKAKKEEHEEVVRVSDDAIKIDGEIYKVSFKKFGDSLFYNENFNKVFFTKDVLTEIFKINDYYFNLDLFAIATFWDKLLVDNELYQYLKAEFPEVIKSAYQNKEVAYVKIAVKESGNDVFTQIDDLNTLLRRSNDFSIVLFNENSLRVTTDSPIGLVARALYLTGVEKIDDLNNANVIKQVKQDDKIREAVCVPEVINHFGPEDELFKVVVNDDVNLGLVLSQAEKIEDRPTFSQLVYDSTYEEQLKQILLNAKLTNILNYSKLTRIIFSDFISKFSTIANVKNNIMVFVNDEKEATLGYVDNNGNVVKITKDLMDDSKKPIKSIVDNKNINTKVVFANNGSLAYLTLSKDVMFESNDDELYFSMLHDKKIDNANSYGFHMLSFLDQKENNVVDNKYHIEDSIDYQNVKYFEVNKDNGIIIKDDNDIVLFGEFDGDKIKLKNTAMKIENIKTFFISNKTLFVVTNDNSVYRIEENKAAITDILDFAKDTQESAINNGVNKVIQLNNVMFVLDNKNKLWYREDGATSTIKIGNVSDIELSGEGVTVYSDSKYVLINIEGSIKKIEI